MQSFLSIGMHPYPRLTYLQAKIGYFPSPWASHRSLFMAICAAKGTTNSTVMGNMGLWTTGCAFYLCPFSCSVWLSPRCTILILWMDCCCTCLILSLVGLVGFSAECEVMDTWLLGAPWSSISSPPAGTICLGMEYVASRTQRSGRECKI